MIRKIKGAKFAKGRTLCPSFLEILDDQTERAHNNVKCDQLMHNDLINAFAKLRFHFAHLSDLKEMVLIPTYKDLESEWELFQARLKEEQEKPEAARQSITFDPKGLENIDVSGFVIIDNSEVETVIITGSKTIGLKSISFDAPEQELVGTDYEFNQELAIDIQSCIYEVEQYLFFEKYAVKQLEIPFGEKDPDGSEMDQKASEVAGAVLGQLADSIMEGNPKKGKKGKKGKVIEMSSTDQVEVSAVETF